MRVPTALVESTARLHGANDLAGMLARDLIETRRIIKEACEALAVSQPTSMDRLSAVLILNRALPMERI